jgi:hypothetical protein
MWAGSGGHPIVAASIPMSSLHANTEQIVIAPDGVRKGAVARNDVVIAGAQFKNFAPKLNDW